MDQRKKHLLYLFQRPLEPVFMPKGEGSVSFDVPQNFLAPRFRSLGTSLLNRFAEQSKDQVTLRTPKTLPPLDELLTAKLARHETFSLFVPEHQRLAGLLVDHFMKAADLDELLSVAAYARDRLNPYLFNYALSVALLHRTDTQDVPVPSLFSTFPHRFIVGQEFGRIDEAIAFRTADQKKIVVELTETTANPDLEAEQRLAYFREDIAVNLHHWHWHLVYPADAKSFEVYNKDRRGELFYYVHQQMMARYNVERMCNNMNFTIPLTELSVPMEEGYYSKLVSSVSGMAYGGREQNMVLKDMTVAPATSVETMNTWKRNLLEAINQGYCVDKEGNRHELDETDGINILGNMVESCRLLNPDADRYGNYHNMGHLMISRVNDPTGQYKLSPGVMCDVATAMRDPIFYRWHTNIDNIFQALKTKQSPYPLADLTFTGVTVKEVAVKPAGLTTATDDQRHDNRFQTFWQKSEVNIAHGLNFQTDVPGPLYVRFTHLNHVPFTYDIQVENGTGAERKGTCRIFMAPKHDYAGRPMMFDVQRSLMMEMDKFEVTLKPGLNEIHRTSKQNSVTIPFDVSFGDLDQYAKKTETADSYKITFCGCGWPEHMLVPKGSVDGFAVQLFVMVSDFEGDRVDQDLAGGDVCKSAGSYCGIRNRKYPDRRPMGYPFDRRARSGAETLHKFLTPNMHVVDAKIYHNPNMEFWQCVQQDSDFRDPHCIVIINNSNNK